MEFCQERTSRRSTVLPHFSPVGSAGTRYRVTFLIFCFKSQAKSVGLTEGEVKLARARYSTAVSSSPSGIQNSPAGSQRHRSQPVTLVLHPAPLPLKPFTVSTASKWTGRTAIISRSSTQRNQNAGVFSSASEQKENHKKKKGVISFPFCKCIHHSSSGKRATAFKNTKKTWKRSQKKEQDG